MKFSAVCVLAVAYFAALCYSEPFIMELPGYAKTVMGAYGKFYCNRFDKSNYIPTYVALKKIYRKP